MRLHPTTPARRGFTLIEVLVAAGLCMLIMAVLAEAFGAGVGTFSLLKSTGELDSRLKVAKTVMRADLMAPHLEAETGEPVKVSQLRLDRIGAPERFARPQPFGFFRIAQDRLPPGATAADPANPPAPFDKLTVRGANVFAVTYPEGQDPDGVLLLPPQLPQDSFLIPSTRATSHTLQMAVRLPATRNDRVATAKMPQATAADQPRLNQVLGLSLSSIDNDPSRFSSQWYEVSYFLNPTPVGTTGTLPLFSLHRRVRCLLPKDAPANVDWWPFAGSNTDATVASTYAPGMSFHRDPPLPQTPPSGGPPRFVLNNVATIREPGNRTGGLFSNRSVDARDPHNRLVPVGTAVTPAPATEFPAPNVALTPTGEDILLTNVLSFEVRVAWDGGAAVVPSLSPPAATAATAVPSYDELPFTDLPAFRSDGTSGNPNFLRVDGTTGLPIAGNTAPFTALRVFDTWTTQGNWTSPTTGTPPQANPEFVPLPIRLKAVQIKLRLYDPKNKLTRQMTFVQDL